MKRSQDRILTTHVGSLVRPPDLLAAADAARADPAAETAYQEALQGAVANVVAKQAAVGIDIVNDGELSKTSWANYVLERLEGFEVRPDDLRPIEWLGRDLERFPDVCCEAVPTAATGAPTQACATVKAKW